MGRLGNIGQFQKGKRESRLAALVTKSSQSHDFDFWVT
jgi:hypothetical protein